MKRFPATFVLVAIALILTSCSSTPTPSASPTTSSVTNPPINPEANQSASSTTPLITVPSPDGKGATPTPTPSSYTAYNALDAAAITGALIASRQVPPVSSKLLPSFMNVIRIAKGNPAQSTLDLGVFGNTLVDYSISAQGSSAPICIAVAPPKVTGIKPGQKTWVLYYEPATKTSPELVLIQNGITTCAQAEIAASHISSADRVKISEASRATAKEAILELPTNILTKIGLLVLDEARKPTTSSSPTPDANGVTSEDASYMRSVICPDFKDFIQKGATGTLSQSEIETITSHIYDDTKVSGIPQVALDGQQLASSAISQDVPTYENAMGDLEAQCSRY